MARAASLDVKKSDLPNDGMGLVGNFFKHNWSNELCSEHDGTIPDFRKAHDKIADLAGFSDLMKPKQKNIYGTAKRSAAIASILVPAGGGLKLAGKAIAYAANSRSVSATSSSSAGFVRRVGYGVAGTYFKAIPDFDFTPLRPLKTSHIHQIVVVNGFLTEDGQDTTDWTAALASYHPDRPLWHLNWQAKNLRKLGEYAAAAVASKFLDLSLDTAITAASTNPWHSAMLNAEKTGVLLAEAISRTEGQTFTLIGHSLGARVIFFALMALATKEQRFIEKAILMGGAVGCEERASWLDASSAVKGTLYNCYSSNDDTLRFLYRTANAGLSSPAGLGAAATGAENVDCTDFISGHNVWKENLPKVLNRIQLLAATR